LSATGKNANGGRPEVVDRHVNRLPKNTGFWVRKQIIRLKTKNCAKWLLLLIFTARHSLFFSFFDQPVNPNLLQLLFRQ